MVDRGVTGSFARCLVVWAGASGAAVALVAWLVPVALEAGSPGGPTAFADLLTATCAAAALVATCWLWVLVTAVVREACGGRRAIRGVPAWLRRCVLAACGAAVVAGVAAPSQATPGDLHHDRARPTTVVAGLPYPDRATALPGGALVTSGPLSGGRPPAQRTVVVRPGDTLWSLAADHLGDGERWAEIYELNRRRIGADPDLIRPDLRLRMPDPRP